MLKLEHVALELLEYKLEEVRAHRPVRGGLTSVWDLYHHLRRQAALLAPDERERLEAAERTLRHLSENTATSKPPAVGFEDLVIDDGSESEIASQEILTPTQHLESDAGVRDEQKALQRLAARVWRHDTERFVRRIAGGLRAERDRYTARLLFATHRNLHLHLHGSNAADISSFQVRERIPSLDDALFSSNDLDSLIELVHETIDCALRMAAGEGPYGRFALAGGSELATLRTLALAVATDPYAGRLGLLPQKGPNSQQIRVAIAELGKERMRDDERASQRRQLEERLQQALAFERHQRQLFHQDVERFSALTNAFFDRLARYLPHSIGGEAGPARLTGGVLFAVNPALRAEAGSTNGSSVTIRLKGPTRLMVGGERVSISGAGVREKLYVSNDEHVLEGELSVKCERKWLHAFREGEYLHLKVEDEGRSVAARAAEAAAALQVMSSRHNEELVATMCALANGSSDDPGELVSGTLGSLAIYTAQAPDRAAAVRGFVLGAARAAGVELPPSETEPLARNLYLALTVDAGDLAAVLEEVDLGEVAVHTLTGEPLALEVATFNLTVRQYRSSEAGSRESLVVMLPGQTVGTFDEYLIERLGNGLLICIRGDQELVVGYLRDTVLTDDTSITSTIN